MEKFLHIFLHTLKDLALLLPFLFAAYVLIEIIEYYSAKKMQHSKLLTSKFSTLFGASFGLIPQCGFSVIAADLYSHKKIKLGTLLAVCIATSDEAIPLLLTSPNKILSLLPLLLIKFIVAIAVGYITDLIIKTSETKTHISLTNTTIETHSHANKDLEHHKHDQHLDPTENLEIHTGCCGHDIDKDGNNKSNKLKLIFIHPLIHTLKIFAFIFAITFAFNGLIEILGELKITTFLQESADFSPFVAALIGLIPNCASSVIITNLYTIGGIRFGALVSGLIVNSGIALVILFKQNKNIKQNFAIMGTLLITGIVVGYIIQLIGC